MSMKHLRLFSDICGGNSDDLEEYARHAKMKGLLPKGIILLSTAGHGTRARRARSTIEGFEEAKVESKERSGEEEGVERFDDE